MTFQIVPSQEVCYNKMTFTNLRKRIPQIFLPLKRGSTSNGGSHRHDPNLNLSQEDCICLSAMNSDETKYPCSRQEERM